MRIKNDNHFVQSRLPASTGKIGKVSLPDDTEFHFNTKKAPAMSDEKYREAIIKQAQKDQSVGEFQTESAGYRNLVKSYVSAVSPDRKNMIAGGLTAIFKNNNPQSETLNLIDYLLGTVKYCKESTELSYAEFYDKNGEMVASYSNGKWISYGTKQENARESELWSIYNDAWNHAARASKENQPEVSTDSPTGDFISISV